MMVETKRKRPKQNEESESTFKSFLEMFTTGFNVAVFALVFYLIKEGFVLINGALSTVYDYPADVVQFLLIPTLMIVILGIIAFNELKKC